MTPHADRTRRLVLLRHAKAERAMVHGDALRPLSLAGRRQAADVGALLLRDALVPEVAFVSSALRTHQTWERLATALDTDPEVTYLDELYQAGARELVGLVRGADDRVRTLLVVGHEPTISATAARLADHDSDPAALALVRVGVPTATYCVLELEAPWSQLEHGGARLTRVVTAARER